MNQNRFNKEELCNTYIFVGSLSDLSKLDLSYLNLRFIDLNNEQEVTEYYKQFSIDDWAIHNVEIIDIIKKDFFDHDKMYLLTPQNFEKIIIDELYYDCWRALYVLFPSDIQILNECKPSVWYTPGNFPMR